MKSDWFRYRLQMLEMVGYGSNVCRQGRESRRLSHASKNTGINWKEPSVAHSDVYTCIVGKRLRWTYRQAHWFNGYPALPRTSSSRASLHPILSLLWEKGRREWQPLPSTNTPFSITRMLWRAIMSLSNAQLNVSHPITPVRYSPSIHTSGCLFPCTNSD